MTGFKFQIIRKIISSMARAPSLRPHVALSRSSSSNPRVCVLLADNVTGSVLVVSGLFMGATLYLALTLYQAQNEVLYINYTNSLF